MYMTKYRPPQVMHRHHGGRKWDGVTYRPRVNAYEGEDKYMIELEMPGVAKADMKINYRDEDGILIITGERFSGEGGERKVNRRYERHFSFTNKIDDGNISAGLSHGVLKIEIPKVLPRVKEIEVK